MKTWPALEMAWGTRASSGTSLEAPKAPETQLLRFPPWLTPRGLSACVPSAGSTSSTTSKIKNPHTRLLISFAFVHSLFWEDSWHLSETSSIPALSLCPWGMSCVYSPLEWKLLEDRGACFVLFVQYSISQGSEHQAFNKCQLPGENGKTDIKILTRGT